MDRLHYIEVIRAKLLDRTEGPKNTDLDAFLLNNKQALYVADILEMSFTYQRNIDVLLGYTAQEFTLENSFDLIHPDDVDVYHRLVSAAVNLSSNHFNDPEKVTFNLSYRIRKKSGEYLKVLRNTRVLEVDTNDRMISNLSIITDISFLDSSNEVSWNLEGIPHDIERFKTEVRKSFAGFFSQRELEVIEGLKAGESSKIIADNLDLSKHTVDTHRRRMLKKAGVFNTAQLIEFANKNYYGKS